MATNRPKRIKQKKHWGGKIEWPTSRNSDPALENTFRTPFSSLSKNGVSKGGLAQKGNCFGDPNVA